jgi:hypothetical protein
MSNVEEQQFRRRPSGGLLDIVKKGYARDAGRPSASSVWTEVQVWFLIEPRLRALAHMDPSSRTASSSWVYLDANWSF